MESSEATKSGSQKHAYNDPWAAPVMLSTVILFARVRSLIDILKYTLKRNERWDPAYKGVRITTTTQNTCRSLQALLTAMELE